MPCTIPGCPSPGAHGENHSVAWHDEHYASWHKIPGCRKKGCSSSLNGLSVQHHTTIAHQRSVTFSDGRKVWRRGDGRFHCARGCGWSSVHPTTLKRHMGTCGSVSGGSGGRGPGRKQSARVQRSDTEDSEREDSRGKIGGKPRGQEREASSDEDSAASYVEEEDEGDDEEDNSHRLHCRQTQVRPRRTRSMSPPTTQSRSLDTINKIDSSSDNLVLRTAQDRLAFAIVLEDNSLRRLQVATTSHEDATRRLRAAVARSEDIQSDGGAVMVVEARREDLDRNRMDDRPHYPRPNPPQPPHRVIASIGSAAGPSRPLVATSSPYNSRLESIPTRSTPQTLIMLGSDSSEDE